MRTPKTIIAVRGGLLGLVLAIALCPAASAQESWSPFRQGRDGRDEARPPRSEAVAPLPPAPARERAGEPAYPAPAPWRAPRSGGVERSELAPVMAPDASGLPLELWRGLDLKGLEELLAAHDLRISDVSMLVGYDDPKYFGQIFRKVAGESPLDFQRKIQHAGDAG